MNATIPTYYPPCIPPCFRRFIIAAELEIQHCHAICEELPSELWPAWVTEGWTRLMTLVPPMGGGGTAVSQ